MPPTFEGHRSADWLTLQKLKSRRLRCGEVAAFSESAWANGVSYGQDEVPKGKGVEVVVLGS